MIIPSVNSVSIFSCSSFSFCCKENDEKVDLEKNKLKVTDISSPLPLYFDQCYDRNSLEYAGLLTSHLTSPIMTKCMKAKYEGTFNLPSKTKNIWLSLTKYNGKTIYSFSQTIGALGRGKAIYQQSYDGICYSLLVHWMLYDVLSIDFFSVFFNDIGDARPFMFNSVKVLERDSSQSGMEYQEKVIHQWLSNYELINIKNLIKRDISKETGCACLLHHIFKQISLEPYHLISMWDNIQGHIFGIKYVDNTITFCDANYGLYSFESLENFNDWIRNELWKNSDYSSYMRNFKISSYKRV